MRRHRIFVRDLKAGALTLTGSDAQHLAQVLRARPGTAVRGFDGRGLEATGEVRHIDPFAVEIYFAEPQPSEVEACLEITCAVALLKGDKLSVVVRRVTELGAARIVPLIAQRCDVRELKANKLARLRRVAQEAAKQCGRSVVPEVSEALSLAALTWEGAALVASPAAAATLNDVMADAPTKICLLSGPEGGFSEAEIADLVARGAHAVGLGRRILRAETAPIAMVAALLLPDAL